MTCECVSLRMALGWRAFDANAIYAAARLENSHDEIVGGGDWINCDQFVF